MTGTAVHCICDEMGFRVVSSVHGYELPTVYGKQERVRLERGGGIAGHANDWRLVSVTSGTVLTSFLTTASALRRALREWAAGPRPTRGKWYAKLHRTRFGEEYVWAADRPGTGPA